MILGQRDRERVDTAELRIVTAESGVDYWRQRAEVAEAGQARNGALVAQEVAQNERLTEWARGIAVEAGEQVRRSAGQADRYAGQLDDLEARLRELHRVDGVAGVCRHCGFTYPCPTIAAVPSIA